MPTRWRSLITSPRATTTPTRQYSLARARVPAAVIATKTWSDDGWDSSLVPFSADPEEFKDLAKTLRFLKFDEDQVAALYGFIGSGIKIASLAGALIGSYDTVKKLLESFGVLESENAELNRKLDSILEAVNRIYKNMELRERKGLSSESGDYRADEITARTSRWSAEDSLAAIPLNNLQGHADRLLRNLVKMLDTTVVEGFSNQDITFWRDSYRKPNGSDDFVFCTFPFVSKADGSPIPNYAHGPSSGVETIWDPGHYVDALLSSLKEFILCCGTLEPGYRSTSHYAEGLADLAARMKAFGQEWKANLLVANPAACLAPDGRMVNGYDPAPMGLLVGAIDPVTGVSNLGIFGEFQIKMVWDWTFYAHGHGPDRTYAIDSTTALQSALLVHRKLVRNVENASGLNAFMTMQRQVEELAKQVVASQFVELPPATFGFPDAGSGMVQVQVRTAFGEDTEVGLGKLDVYADVPGKTWPAKRFRQTMQKRFRFRMARRSKVSEKRLGYTLVIGGHKIPLTTPSFSTTSGGEASDFPVDPISLPILIDVEGAHCCQTSHFSKAREDRFEREGYDDGRVLAAHGTAKGNLTVDIAFEPFSGGNELSYTGDVIVTITNVDPYEFEDSFEFGIDVRESVFTKQGGIEEISGDNMSVYMMPSYLIVDASYLDAYRKAFENMIQSVKHIDIKFKKLVTEIGPPNPLEDPDWTRHRIQSVNSGINFIDAAVQRFPETLAQELQDILVPRDIRQ